MVKKYHDISDYIINQFPDIYKENGGTFISFVKAYYEFLDEKYSDNKDNLENIDVDKTLEEFLGFFKNTYLKDFPFVTASDQKFMIKHILDFYKSKGSALSTELLIKLIFGDESYIYKPSKDIFKPSTSKWVVPEYIEVEKNPRTKNFINKGIIGSKSKATAIVEGVVTKRINGKYIDVLYITSVVGNFLKDEYISEDGIIKNAPKVTGSLTEVSVENGGRNNKIGDIFDVVAVNGLQGKVRVTGVENATGRVDFQIEDGGFGYTLTPDTDVYVSDAILSLKNDNLDFKIFEKVYQKIEEITLLSVDLFQDNMSTGNYLVGMNANGNVIANGTILSNAFDGASSTVNIVVSNGTFGPIQKLILDDNFDLLEEEYIEEENELEITINSNTAPLSVGNRVEQYNAVDYGEISGTIVLTSVSGTFVDGETVTQNNGANLAISASIYQILSATSFKIKGIHLFAAPREFTNGVVVTGVTSGATGILSSYTPDVSTTIFTNFSSGIVSAISGSTLTLNNSWGEFNTSSGIKVYANSTSSVVIDEANVSGVVNLSYGARGKITVKESSDVIFLDDIVGDFTVGKTIKGDKTNIKKEITSVVDESVTDVLVNGNTSMVGVLDTYTNTSPSAIVIGQNTSSIGIFGNTNPFISSGDIEINSTRKTISAVSVNSFDIATLEFEDDHELLVGDHVNILLDIQQDSEVKRIYGVYEILSVPVSTRYTIQLEPDYAQIIRDGGFSIFNNSNSVKTVYMTIKTDRANIYDPPRNSNGDIIELDVPIFDISTGQDANFEIGTLENEEVVNVNTDIIGGENVAGIDFLAVNIDGSNSGIGFVSSMDIISGGSGYTNGNIITFAGGGYANGSPVSSAVAHIATNGSGTIVNIIVDNAGQGYYTTPSITLPTGSVVANIAVNMDFGYGFAANPKSDFDTIISDVLTNENMTIGTISTLSKINPGSDYNANPFVKVYNPFIAGFDRGDYILFLDNDSVGFEPGETISQDMGEEMGDAPKGIVISSSGNQLYVKRISFNVAFTVGEQIIGETTGSAANIVSIFPLSETNVAGENAIINGIAISANGIATTLEVIDSGFGYEDNAEVTLTAANTPFVMTGVANVEKHGKGEGKWHTFESHPSATAKIQDSYYYQEYSYEIVTGKSLDKYEEILKNILHVSGTKMFGRVEKRNSVIYNSKIGTSLTTVSGLIIPDPVVEYSFLSSVNSDLQFLRSGSATYFNNEGVMATAGINEPRFEYDPITLVAKGLLLEETRTNHLLRSEHFGNATWSKNASTVTNDLSISPNGYQTADKITNDTSNATHGVSQSVSVDATGTYTLSVYASMTEDAVTRWVRLAMVSGVNRVEAWFDLLTGTLGSVANVGVGSLAESKIVPVGNGYYRLILTGKPDTTNTGVVSNLIRLAQSNNDLSAYTGNTTQSIYVFGAQMETGTFATSYIYTTTTGVTRAADALNSIEPHFSTWFNKTVGTFALEFSGFGKGKTSGVMFVQKSASAPRYQMTYSSTGSVGAAVVNDLGTVVVPGLGGAGVVTFGDISKAAFTYKENDFASTRDGLTPATDNSGDLPLTVDVARFGFANGIPLNGHLRRFRYWKYRLTNAHLQEITQ